MMLVDFLNDEDATDMFITGVAGTGKTTSLAKLVNHCVDNSITYQVCAFTHKACSVLAAALPEGAIIDTLHAFLKKRPAVNTEAKHVKEVSVNTKAGTSEVITVLFVDEYSMVGERDLMDIRGIDQLKVVWIGDPHQLPPVGDMQSVRPYGQYQQRLTTVHRQANSNPLLETLQQLVSFIEGAKPTPLRESANFIRKQDIVARCLDDRKNGRDCALLAYTNKRVQELNARCQGRSEAYPGDTLFSFATREPVQLNAILAKPTEIYVPYSRKTILLGSKYRTLEHLIALDCCDFFELDDGTIQAVIFGCYNYKLKAEQLSKQAVVANLEIEKKGIKASTWARENPDHPLAKARSKAWRDFLTFNECVVCMDFNYAITVHKSQGSTYNTVYLDSEDLAIAAEFNYTMYLKLMYVALSRASNKVVTN